MKIFFFENVISAKQETLGFVSLKTFNDLLIELPVTSSSPLTEKVTFIQQT